MRLLLIATSIVLSSLIAQPRLAHALSDISCASSKDTGYVAGSAFAIEVVRIDDKAVERDTANAYYFMAKAAQKDGVQIRVVSGFRTMAQQQYLYNCYQTCSCNSCNLAAVPGYSNHQSGSALDLNTSAPGVYSWLSAHGNAFGFVRTVPSETWHWEYQGPRPVGGPCGTLDAELREAWSDAEPDSSGDADYVVCAGNPFHMWFEMKNIGTARWADLGTDGWYVGERVKLEPVGGGVDLLTGRERVRLSENANDNVRPASWGGGAGDACNDAPKCRRTIFSHDGMEAIAPVEPGIYKSRWQLVDRTPVSDNELFGPVAKLSFRVQTCAGEPPTFDPGDTRDRDPAGEDHRASGANDATSDGDDAAGGCSASGQRGDPTWSWLWCALSLAGLCTRRPRRRPFGHEQGRPTTSG